MPFPVLLRNFKFWLLLGVVAVVVGRYLYFRPRFSGDESAPDFEAFTAEGLSFRLSDLRGKYVLMHFWGSWCGPCRRENPQLVELYRRYGGEQFSIVSVAIERDDTRWENARLQDGLYWPLQCMEITPSLRFFDSPIANLFGVKKLPTLFLLNPQGHIIATDPSPAKLDELIRHALE
jgi:thiol-disulfide isomerase/thioredoxin